MDYISKYIYLQKGLSISDNEKNEVLSESKRNTKRVLCVEPYNLEKIIYEDSDIYYHEFIHNDYNQHIKLFFDIDIKEKNTDNMDDTVKEFIKIIIKFLKSLTQDERLSSISTIESSFTKYIYKNVAVTTSTDINKISYHIFFNRVYININVLEYLKKKIQNLMRSNETDNILLENIDLNVYKRNTKLRTIYSKKKDDNNIHIKTFKERNDILMYMFSYVDFTDQHLVFESLNNILEKDIARDIEKFIENPNTNNVKLLYLKGYKIKYLLFKYLSSVFNVYIENNYLEPLNDKEGFREGEEYEFRFVNDECVCSEKHKNNHFLKFRDDNLLISKRGNPTRCMSLVVNYPPLSWFEIGCIIYNYLKILIFVNNKFILIWDGKTWKQLLEKNLLLPTIMKKENFKIFRSYEDKLNIETKLIQGTNVDAILSVVKYKSINSNTNIYSFSFTNGVYDFVKDEFFTGDDAKEYINLYNSGYDYTPPSMMNEEERKEFDENYEYLLKVLDDIIPEYIDGNLNQNRIRFDIIMSLMLVCTYKGLIIFFVGPTASGKSTITMMMKTLLGSNNYVDISLNNYTEESDPEKTPKPALGRSDFKLATFAHESGYNTKYKAVLFKKNTEKNILARKCHSNDTDQTNVAIHFIDTNFDPNFDLLDDATIRRTGIIRIDNSYFVRDKKTNLKDEEYLFIQRKKKIADYKLELKFNNGDLTIPLFEYFKKKLLKYHLPKITFPDFNMETDIDKIRCATIYSAFVDMENIKSEYRNLYEEKVFSSTKRLYMTLDIFKQNCLDEKIVEDEESLKCLVDKEYFCVFKNHIKDLKQTERKRERFIKEKEKGKSETSL